MPKNKAIHITYIGRLVQEKGILIVLECIKRSILEKRNIVWHICGDGEYIDNFKEMNHP
jgi:glycosyltransferase involved in cell wall biosynthesis